MFRIRAHYYEFASPEEMGLHHDIPTITFRGAFGYALAQVIAREGCIPGLKSQVELYRRFFMPENDGTEESRNRDLARPFVLRGFYSRPDRRSFILQIILFGIAAEYGTFFDRVVEVMSYMGIGKSHRVCHFEKLNEVEYELPELDATGELRIRFLTPCAKLKQNKKIYEDHIPFHVLIPRLVDRLLELDNLYGDGSFGREWDVAGMKRDSRMIASCVESGGVWQAKRISGRTGQEMFLSGFVGTMQYQGDFRPFLEPLRYLPYVNLGRFNVFGCGWCTIQFLDNQ